MALSAPQFYTDAVSGFSFDPTIQKWLVPQPAAPAASSAGQSHLQSFVPPESHISQSSSDAFPSSPDLSSTSSASPPSTRASSPIFHASLALRPTSKPSTSRRRAKDPKHIPRPPNCFIIFRSMACPYLKEVESDHRMISRIASNMWKQAPEPMKQIYRDLACALGKRHKEDHPGYAFSPKQRMTPPKKRKVKRNDEATNLYCDEMADAVMRGESGEQLKTVRRKYDDAEEAQSRHNDASEQFATGVFDSKIPSLPPPSPLSSTSSSDETPFRSPLLPPATPMSPASPVMLVTTPSEPLSPLNLLPSETHTPVIAVVPLSDIRDEPMLSQPIDYSFQATYAPSPTSFGTMQTHEHGSLALTHMYTPETTPFMLVAHNEDYAFQSEPFVHDLSAPLNPALAHTFSFSEQIPSEIQLPASQPFEAPLPAYDSHYALVDPAAQMPVDMQMPFSANDIPFPSFQPLPMGFASGQSFGQSTDVLNAWPYQESGLDVSMHAQNMLACGWVH